MRSWALLGEDRSGVLLNVKGRRFCGNVEREHKSNGVFLVVDMLGRSWCQRCYDPECR